MPSKVKKASKVQGGSVEDHNKASLPKWPAFGPRTPAEDLVMHELCPGQIVTIPNFWTATLCKKFVRFLEQLPLTTTPGNPKRGEAVRVNDRFQVDDAQFAERLWSETGLKDLVLGHVGADSMSDTESEASIEDRWGGSPIGLNPNIRVYRYSQGQFFDKHYDDSNILTHPGPPSRPGRTTWTLLLYLTSARDGCVGGETVFYPESFTSGKKSTKNQAPPDPIVVSLENGTALLHKHGKECMLHEGREVLEGNKWVLRSDLCVSR